MDRYQIELLIKKSFALTKKELEILEEFCEAVHLRLAQNPEPFNEVTCLKCWQTYLLERLPVYTSP